MTSKRRQEGRALQGSDDLVIIFNILDGQDVDDDFPPGKDGDEVLHFQLEERVAEGRLAHAELFRRLFHIDHGAGHELAAAHLVAQILVNLFLQGLDIQDRPG